MTEFNYIPIIGYNYLDPIALLLEKLEELPNIEVNEVQTSQNENGFSVSIIILLVLMMESLINRINEILGQQDPHSAKKSKEPSYLYIKRIFPNSNSNLLELIVVRDVIVHNHVYDTQIEWNENFEMELISAEIKHGYGDKKFNEAINLEERNTKILGINIFPTRINREDVKTVLNEVTEFLLFVENIDRNLVYISPQHIIFRGQLLRFPELIEKLREH